MFIDIIAAVIMTVAGVGFIGFGLMSRKGVFTLIGGLVLLLIPALFEGYSVDTWVNAEPTMTYTNSTSAYMDIPTSTTSTALSTSAFRINGQYFPANDYMVGKTIDKLTIGLSKSGTPTGDFYIGVVQTDGDISTLFGSKLASSLTTSEASYTFTFPQYVVQSGDIIAVKYNNTGSPNTVNSFVNGNDLYGGQTSSLFQWQSGTASVPSNAFDMRMSLDCETCLVVTFNEGGGPTLSTVPYEVLPAVRALVGVGIGTVLFVLLKKQGLG